MLVYFILSIVTLAVVWTISFTVSNSSFVKKHKFVLSLSLGVGVFLSSIIAFIPIHLAGDASFGSWARAVGLAIFNSMQIFTLGCEFGVVNPDGLVWTPDWIKTPYQVWLAILFVVAPIFTFGFVLSFVRDKLAKIKYLFSLRGEVFVFSELNERSLTLAKDVKGKNKSAVIVFTDAFKENEEGSFELFEEARKLKAICFRDDIVVHKFSPSWSKRKISFFTIGANETENLTQTLKLIERYRDRANTHIYAFSTNVDGEILLSSTDKGKIKVRRINEVQSLVNRLLYERGETIFADAKPAENGLKRISAVVVGMGRYGTEMVKALSWYGQMDGYDLKISAFDKDPLSKDKFVMLAPELMDERFNGVENDNTLPRYKIDIYPDTDVNTQSFVSQLRKITDATFVFVSLGSDDDNIGVAVNLRMQFERMKIKPTIVAVVHNSAQKRALDGVKNFKGQPYDIDFVGDLESLYIHDVIIDSELEEEALRRHLKWGAEEEFWNYEYNYRSSIATALHLKARIKCGVPGATKRTEDLTKEERETIENLEHKRWCVYMRSEGYVYSGSNEKSSRNDLGKMHHDLVVFDDLSIEDKRKDSSVGAH
ncbi:MAG: hypothetical protein IKC64_01630 [Clostridia bacterium]|nr:hypothetical protein [Clostridia bacterium]